MMNTIHICTASDKNYKLPLTALLNSIYLNSASHPCVMHILYTDIPKRYQRKLQNKYKGTNLSVEFIDVSSYDFNCHELNMQYWTKAIFYRIMIPEIFQDLERILYIDGDTLVLQDLYDFFNTSFQDDTYLTMIVDRFSWKHQMHRLKTSNYFNSGVILFDIAKCRQDDFSNKCIKWLQDNPKLPIYPDQDAINAVCDGKIMRASNLYNKMVVPSTPETISEKPFIIHFLSSTKPWMYSGKLRYCKFYRQYIPCWFNRNLVFIKQLLYKIRRDIFRIDTVEVFKCRKVISQKEYRLFSKLIYSKTLEEKDILEIMKESRNR